MWRKPLRRVLVEEGAVKHLESVNHYALNFFYIGFLFGLVVVDIVSCCSVIGISNIGWVLGVGVNCSLFESVVFGYPTNNIDIM